VDEYDPLHSGILSPVTNSDVFLQGERNSLLQAGDILPLMTPAASDSPHSLATASGLLLGTLGAAMALGALIGWAVGSWAIGLLIGAVAGIPLAVLVVYLVYSEA
jgi:hypothetical protein